jgi:hypothetical protein
VPTIGDLAPTDSGTVEKLDRRQALDLSQYYASGKDPQAHARTVDIANRRGLPVETVERNLDRIRQLDRREALDFKNYIDTNPGLSEYLSNRDNAAVSYDDIDPLKGFEDALNSGSFMDTAKNLAIDLTGKGSVALGQSAVGISEFIGGGLVRNLLSPLSVTNPELVDQAVNAATEDVFNKFYRDTIGYRPEEAKQIFSSYQSKRRQAADAEIAKAQGFFETFGALLDNPESMAGMAAESALSMISTGAIVKGYAGALLLKNGLTKGSAEAANFLSQASVKAKLATVSAAAEGLISSSSSMQQNVAEGVPFTKSAKASLGTFATTAAFSKISSKYLPDVEAEFAIAGSRKVKLMEGLKDIGKAVVKEGALEEMPQSAFEQIWSNYAKDNPWLEGVGSSAATGLILGGVMGGGMSTVSTTMNVLSKQTENKITSLTNAVFEQQKIDDLITYAQSSKTAEIAPAQWQDYLDKVGSDKYVYLDSEAAKNIEGLPDSIINQINDSGEDIEIPIKQFAVEIATNNSILDQVRPYIKLSASGSTQEQINNTDIADLNRLVEKAVKKKENLTESERIFEEVKSQLIDTGRMSADSANIAAKIIPAYVATTAEKYKITPKQVYDKMGLKVVGPEYNMDQEARSLHQARIDKVQNLLDCLGG